MNVINELHRLLAGANNGLNINESLKDELRKLRSHIDENVEVVLEKAGTNVAYSLNIYSDTNIDTCIVYNLFENLCMGRLKAG